MESRSWISRGHKRFPLLFLTLFLILLMPIAELSANGPIITSINDSDPPLSGRVAITGTGFGIAGEVYVAGIPAMTSSWTDTRVVAYVPESAPIGPSDLYVDVQGQQSNQVQLVVSSRQANGRVRWTFEAEGNNLWWRPALAPDGTIYIHSNSSTDGLVYALSPNGALLWIQKVNWYPYVPPTAGPDGAVYVGSISRIYRISSQGEIDWSYYDSGSSGPQIAPTIGPDGLLYGAFDGGIGAFAIEPLTGQIVWSNIGNPRLTDKSGEPVEAKFGPSNPGQPADQFYVSMDGVPLMAFSLDGVQRFVASMSNITGSAEVAVGSDGTLYGPRYLGLNVVAVDPSDGSTIWEYYPSDWAVGTDNVAIGPDDMLYFTGSTAKLEAFDPSSQSRKWQVFEQGMLLERPAISPDGSVLVVHGSYGNGQPGFVKGFNPTNGRELWTVNLDGAPYPEPRSLGVHHARITPDSQTAYMSTMTLAGSNTDAHTTLYAINISSGPVDSDPPTVFFDTPVDGSSVSGLASINVSASDNGGLSVVNVSYSSSTGQGQICTASPGGSKNYKLNCNWDTSGLTPGNYNLIADASDTSGNNTTSTISVQVNATTNSSLRSTAINLSAKLRRGTVSATGKVKIVDQDGSTVRDAMVAVTWLLPDGSTFNQTASTNRNGEASFNATGSRGTYTLTITNVVKSGYVFDAANSVLSQSITK